MYIKMILNKILEHEASRFKVATWTLRRLRHPVICRVVGSTRDPTMVDSTKRFTSHSLDPQNP